MYIVTFSIYRLMDMSFIKNQFLLIFIWVSLLLGQRPITVYYSTIKVHCLKRLFVHKLVVNNVCCLQFYPSNLSHPSRIKAHVTREFNGRKWVFGYKNISMNAYKNNNLKLRLDNLKVKNNDLKVYICIQCIFDNTCKS